MIHVNAMRMRQVIATWTRSLRRRTDRAGRGWRTALGIGHPIGATPAFCGPAFEPLRRARHESEAIDTEAWFYSHHAGAGVDIEEHPLETLSAELQEELSSQRARRAQFDVR